MEDRHPTVVQLREYVNGECDDGTAERIRLHVYDCGYCVDLLAAIRRAIFRGWN